MANGIDAKMTWNLWQMTSVAVGASAIDSRRCGSCGEWHGWQNCVTVVQQWQNGVAVVKSGIDGSNGIGNVCMFDLIQLEKTCHSHEN